MKKNQNTLALFLAIANLILFTHCSKEQKQVNFLKGKWQIVQLAINDSSFVSDTLAKQYIEFFACEQAYTATCEGVYFAESLNEKIFKSVKDTFKYNINANNFTITKVKTNSARYLLNRYEIKKINEKTLDFGNDSLKLKASKL